MLLILATMTCAKARNGANWFFIVPILLFQSLKWKFIWYRSGADHTILHLLLDCYTLIIDICLSFQPCIPQISSEIY